MKAYEIMEDVIGRDFLANTGFTVDTHKAGDKEVEVTRIGVCMTATPDVLRAAKEWGAELLITHEPTFYNHLDSRDDSPLCKMKEKLVEESGLVIYRYHDSTHFRDGDKINEGFIRRMGWKGEFVGDMGFELNEGMSPVVMAKEISEKLGVKHPRIVGARDGVVTKLKLALGARGGDPFYSLRDDVYEVAICGELCEWSDCEPIRELAQMGYQKSIIILGHVGSERDAMEYIAKDIDGKYDGAEAKYFECGEIYTYAE